MNGAFAEYLQYYVPEEGAIEALQFKLEQLYYKINEERFEDEKRLSEQLSEVNKKIDTIEEKYYVLNQMSKETFDKFYPKYQKEREEILEQLQKSGQIISNLSQTISEIVSLSTKLTTVWTSKELKIVEGLQKLMFPEGIYYNKKKEAFRTPKVNSVFSYIASVKHSPNENEKGANHFLSGSSLSAEREGFEPPVVLPTTVFKTAALNRSAISPAQI